MRRESTAGPALSFGWTLLRRDDRLLEWRRVLGLPRRSAVQSGEKGCDRVQSPACRGTVDRPFAIEKRPRLRRLARAVEPPRLSPWAVSIDVEPRAGRHRRGRRSASADSYRHLAVHRALHSIADQLRHVRKRSNPDPLRETEHIDCRASSDCLGDCFESLAVGNPGAQLTALALRLASTAIAAAPRTAQVNEMAWARTASACDLCPMRPVGRSKSTSVQDRLRLIRYGRSGLRVRSDRGRPVRARRIRQRQTMTVHESSQRRLGVAIEGFEFSRLNQHVGSNRRSCRRSRETRARDPAGSRSPEMCMRPSQRLRERLKAPRPPNSDIEEVIGQGCADVRASAMSPAGLDRPRRG